MLATLSRLTRMARRSVIFTVAPRTPLLTAMHLAGKLFPRSDRSPRIVPVAPDRLKRGAARNPALGDWRFNREARVATDFTFPMPWNWHGDAAWPPLETPQGGEWRNARHWCVRS